MRFAVNHVSDDMIIQPKTAVSAIGGLVTRKESSKWQILLFSLVLCPNLQLLLLRDPDFSLNQSELCSETVIPCKTGL